MTVDQSQEENVDSNVVTDQEIYDYVINYGASTINQGSAPKAEKLFRRSMMYLLQSNMSLIVFLKDDELRTYWEKLRERAVKNIITRREQVKNYKLRKQVWDRLSEEERSLLGLSRPKAPNGYND